MIARRGSCKFGTVLSSGRKVLLAKSLPHLSGGKPSRILRNKGFSILDEFLSPSYDRLMVSPRDRTLKTKYYKDFRRGAFQLTINPMRDWNPFIRIKFFRFLSLFQLTINPMRDWNILSGLKASGLSFFQLTINPMRDWNRGTYTKAWKS